MNKSLTGSLLIALVITGLCLPATGQRYLTGLDSSLFIKDTVRPFLKRFGNLRFSGYIQPQYQVIEKDGAATYGGGDFSAQSRNRFMLRRARMKIDYLALTEDRLPKALFTFQMDVTERTVRVRDMFVRLYETKGNQFSLTTGIFAKPFGYEVNVSSSFRETPERGRMSQILIPSERDLGVMISYEPQRPGKNKHQLRIDAGVFNGPGLSATTDFDNKKDLVARITYEPLHREGIQVHGGLSLMRGGWKQSSKYVYTTRETGGKEDFYVDSAISNVGKTAPRQYYGGDVQVRFPVHHGGLELRGEIWFGKQPGTATSTINPGTLPAGPTYIRQFSGGFFYLIKDLGQKGHQLLAKYDWYDPNTKIQGKAIGLNNSFTSGDISYQTWGLGYSHPVTENVKLVLYYEHVVNEATSYAGYTADLPDNLFTCRLQFRF